MTYKIEEGIPAPKPRNSYPWTELDVGNSFFVPFDGENSQRVRDRVNQARKYAKRKLGVETVTRVDYEGIRVWRV